MRKSIGAASEEEQMKIKKVIIMLNEEIKVVRTIAWLSLFCNFALLLYIILASL